MRRQITGQFYVWLHVFSCAARHLSFTRCAEELHITPGAVSQQMRQLEEHLGFRLFLRKARGVELCAEGQRLALTVAEAYGSIEAELLRLVAEDSNQALHPDDFDLAIDLNDGSYPGMLSTPLLDEQIFPVCSPALLRGRPPLHGPADLAHYPLLHDITAWRGSSEYAEWEFYLAGIGAEGLDVRRGHTFNRNHLSIEAAIAGVGVAIARRTLLNDELERGALIVPFGVPIANHKRYVLLYPPGGLTQPGARAVHDWLVEEAQVFRALHPLGLVEV